MTLSRFARGALFCAGMVCGATSGNFFYLDRYTAGAAMLALTTTFLFFAMSDLSYHRKDDNEEFAEALAEQQRILATLGILLADNAVDGFKRIGRSMPCTPAELNKFEDDFTSLLNSLKVDRKDRERILQEIDKLRTRSRQEEGRRALSGARP